MLGENPPVGLILCAEKGAAEADYAQEGLTNKVLADELDKTWRELEARRIARGGDLNFNGAAIRQANATVNLSTLERVFSTTGPGTT